MSWVVYYMNYYPREVESTWPTEAEAMARQSELNEADSEGCPWYVEWWDDGMGEPPEEVKK